jgi:hypothetical protein
MASDVDRITASLDALIEAKLARLSYFGIWEYTVTSFDEGAQTASLKPTVNQALPPLTGVPIRLPAMQSKLGSNDSVLIGFANADPTKPYVASLNTASSYDGALAISRQGDMVSIPVMLVPATTGQPPVPVPNAYSIVLATPPPPPFNPATGGPASLYGCVSSGSVVNKSK